MGDSIAAPCTWTVCPGRRLWRATTAACSLVMRLIFCIAKIRMVTGLRMSGASCSRALAVGMCRGFSTAFSGGWTIGFMERPAVLVVR